MNIDINKLVSESYIKDLVDIHGIMEVKRILHPIINTHSWTFTQGFRSFLENNSKYAKELLFNNGISDNLLYNNLDEDAKSQILWILYANYIPDYIFEIYSFFINYKEKYNNYGFRWKNTCSTNDIISCSSNLLGDCKDVLDIGSGIGRYCILSSIKNKDVKYSGVEINKERYECSVNIKNQFRDLNVSFINDNFLNIDISRYDMFFVYSPFNMYLSSNYEGQKLEAKISEYYDLIFDRFSKLKKGIRLQLVYGRDSQIGYIKIPKQFKSINPSFINLNCLVLK